MSRKDEIAEAIRALREEEYLIEAKENQIKAKEFVPEYFVFMNSFGGDRERWPLYIHTIGIDPDTAEITAIQFQKDCNGRIEIETNKYYREYTHNAPITREEYINAWNALLVDIYTLHLEGNV